MWGVSRRVTCSELLFCERFLKQFIECEIQYLHNDSTRSQLSAWRSLAPLLGPCDLDIVCRLLPQVMTPARVGFAPNTLDDPPSDVVPPTRLTAAFFIEG